MPVNVTQIDLLNISPKWLNHKWLLRRNVDENIDDDAMNFESINFNGNLLLQRSVTQSLCRLLAENIHENR